MSTAWEAAPTDRYSAWFRPEMDGLDRWIRSPAAPAAERADAMEQWVAARPNRVVLGEARQAGKYSQVAEYLRARLTERVYLSGPESGRVWIALARSGWLGEWAAEKSLSTFARHAGVTAEVLPHVAEAATRYVPQARTRLCEILHARAEREYDVTVRLALYGAISQVISSANRRRRK
jgi:hypothetical protein